MADHPPADKCEIIGDAEICSQCNRGESQSAPTDGVCSADNNECSQKQDGKCTQCANRSFMYKGGCYKDSQAPGNTMCETANAGVCTLAKAGYFLPPDADRDNAHQSVIPCGDEEEITVKDGKKYKGVLHCTQCSTPDPAQDTNTAKAATCTACEDGFFVDSSNGCTACPENRLTCTGKIVKEEADGAIAYIATNDCTQLSSEGPIFSIPVSEGFVVSCLYLQPRRGQSGSRGAWHLASWAVPGLSGCAPPALWASPVPLLVQGIGDTHPLGLRAIVSARASWYPGSFSPSCRGALLRPYPHEAAYSSMGWSWFRRGTPGPTILPAEAPLSVLLGSGPSVCTAASGVT